MKLLDTSVIMFAIGRPHRWKAPCRTLLDAAASGSGQVQIDVEVFQELLYVYARRGERAKGIALVEDLQVLFPGALPTTVAILSRVTRLLSTHDFLLPRDAIHAAHVLEEGLEGVVSEDRVFGRIPGVRRLDPDGS